MPQSSSNLLARLAQLASLARPGRLREAAQRAAAALERRRLGVETRVVTLEPLGPARGRVLFSYILDPFLLPTGAPLPHGHTHYWESREMAQAWVEAGFTVDCLHWTNRSFVPVAGYDVAIDVRRNLEHWVEHLPATCLRVLHAETSHWQVNNGNQALRLDRLAREHHLRLCPRKLVEPNRAVESAHALTLLGNSFTADSYAFAGLPTWRIPISAPTVYPWPAGRNLATARRHFVWFGSGGLVHKGLDLVLEAFAALPEHQLTVAGPVDRERDFEAAFWRELYHLPNIHTRGWVDALDGSLEALGREALGVVFPSCAEGGGGSVITCMHAGLVPLVSAGASVDVETAWGVRLDETSVAGLRAAVTELAARPLAELEAMARRSWERARALHTRGHFARRYREVVAELIPLAASRGALADRLPARPPSASGPAAAGGTATR